MPSTDIDGSVIVTLSEEEAERVYTRLEIAQHLDDVERKLRYKIERDLEL